MTRFGLEYTSAEELEAAQEGKVLLPSPTTPLLSHPRGLTPAEVQERDAARRAQRDLEQRRRNIKLAEAEQKQESLPAKPRFQVEAPPPKPEPAAMVKAAVEAGVRRARFAAQPTPAQRLARQALGRAQVALGTIRRKDARHNATQVLLALYEASYDLIRVQGQSERATSYTFFTVVDLLPVVTGLSSDQCERATRRLEGMGLIHKSSGALVSKDREGRKVFTGGTWTETTFTNQETGKQKHALACAGTWVDVLLNPTEGQRARVVSHELPPCPRNLTLDRQEGRTAWKQLQKHQLRLKAKEGNKVRESNPWEQSKDCLSPLIQFSLLEKDRQISGTKESRTSIFGDVQTGQDLIWSLSRLQNVHPSLRRAAVQDAAALLVTLLNDTGSERHYYHLLWRATEAEGQGLTAFKQLAHALERTLVASKELPLRRPGAWLIQELRACGWLDTVYHQPARKGAMGRQAA